MQSATSNQLFDGLQSMKDIEWADLVTIDLALYDLPGGKQKLANLITDAIRTSGFFSVKNFGVSKEAIEQQLKLCQALFDLPLEEKLPYHDAAAWARGERVGYRPIGSELRK
jgi:isopenicillin N synthase-like dioxygenase